MVPFIVSSLLLIGASYATESGTMYRVRRRAHALERHMNEDDFFLTHSDEGKSKTLDPFLLYLFETPNNLKEDALPVLRMAMNKFLLEEFNAIYKSQGNELESVGSEIGELAVATNARRSLQETGTEAGMEITLTFDSEPSPSSSELEKDIRIVMADLAYFVTNLTSFQHEDWKDVTQAYRREMPTDSPTAAPVDNTDGVIAPDNEDSSNEIDRNRNSVVMVPTFLVAATLIALVVFLFVQRRARTSAETPKGDDVMFVGVENDLYSMDKSLESSRSPNGLCSPAAASIVYSTSADGSVREDSVFSGMDYSHSVANSRFKGTKSLMSGFTNTSESTMQVSNKQKQARLKLKSYSAAAGGSLFAFDEEPYEEDDYSEGQDHRRAPPELTKSDVSGESDDEMQAALPMIPSPAGTAETSSTLQGTTIEELKPSMMACYGRKAPYEPATSNHVLADLQVLASTRDPSPRDPSPTVVQRLPNSSASVSYNPFNCNPVLPRQEVGKYELEGTSNPALLSSVSPFSNSAEVLEDLETPRNNSFLACAPTFGQSNMVTPLTRNVTTTVSTPGSQRSSNSQKSAKANGPGQMDWGHSVASMSGKATKSIGGVYGKDRAVSPGTRSRASSVDNKEARSTNMSHSGSKSAPNTPERNRLGMHWFKSAKSMPSPDADDYVHNLSRPSTPGGEMNHSLPDLEDSAYGCYPFRRMGDLAPAAPGEDPPASGRRHAGNTGIDGTAMYQTNAMHPLDWSYKSADIQSVGGSTISENDDGAMPRQFLFSGKREPKSTNSLGNEPKTPMSEMSGKSEGTNKTNESSQASASRQLINDLVWLEKKIADVKQGSVSNDQLAIGTVDSLSYVSTDDEGRMSPSSQDESGEDPTVSTGKSSSVMSSIVCRDCYAPPGKLHIVIHSTKDGPAVHTVKQGSSLEGHIFPGDLIISVDNIDTRSFTAEQVMKMMASKTSQERKITVLHFEEE